MPPVSEVTFDGIAHDAIFTPSFFAELCSLMNLSQTRDTLTDLREGHFQAVRAYFDAQYAFQDMKTLKEENRRLYQVAHDAERLCHTLISLFEFGATAALLHKLGDGRTSASLGRPIPRPS